MKRRSLVMVIVGACAAVLVGCMTPEERSAHDLINGDRWLSGLTPLNEDAALVGKAQRWARHLADTSGGTCSTATLRHSDLRDGAPAGWRMLGENVGCRVAPGPVATHVAPLQSNFMASPGHRANIMNGRYNTSGVGLASVPAAIGHGWIVVYEAQEFAQL